MSPVGYVNPCNFTLETYFDNRWRDTKNWLYTNHCRSRLVSDLPNYQRGSSRMLRLFSQVSGAIGGNSKPTGLVCSRCLVVITLPDFRNRMVRLCHFYHKHSSAVNEMIYIPIWNMILDFREERSVSFFG